LPTRSAVKRFLDAFGVGTSSFDVGIGHEVEFATAVREGDALLAIGTFVGISGRAGRGGVAIGGDGIPVDSAIIRVGEHGDFGKGVLFFGESGRVEDVVGAGIERFFSGSFEESDEGSGVDFVVTSREGETSFFFSGTVVGTVGAGGGAIADIFQELPTRSAVKRFLDAFGVGTSSFDVGIGHEVEFATAVREGDALLAIGTFVGISGRAGRGGVAIGGDGIPIDSAIVSFGEGRDFGEGHFRGRGSRRGFGGSRRRGGGGRRLLFFQPFRLHLLLVVQIQFRHRFLRILRLRVLGIPTANLAQLLLSQSTRCAVLHVIIQKPTVNLDAGGYLTVPEDIGVDPVLTGPAEVANEVGGGIIRRGRGGGTKSGRVGGIGRHGRLSRHHRRIGRGGGGYPRGSGGGEFREEEIGCEFEVSEGGEVGGAEVGHIFGAVFGCFEGSSGDVARGIVFVEDVEGGSEGDDLFVGDHEHGCGHVGRAVDGGFVVLLEGTNHLAVGIALASTQMGMRALGHDHFLVLPDDVDVKPLVGFQKPPSVQTLGHLSGTEGVELVFRRRLLEDVGDFHRDVVGTGPNGIASIFVGVVVEELLEVGLREDGPSVEGGCVEDGDSVEDEADEVFAVGSLEGRGGRGGSRDGEGRGGIGGRLGRGGDSGFGRLGGGELFVRHEVAGADRGGDVLGGNRNGGGGRIGCRGRDGRGRSGGRGIIFRGLGVGGIGIGIGIVVSSGSRSRSISRSRIRSGSHGRGGIQTGGTRSFGGILAVGLQAQLVLARGHAAHALQVPGTLVVAPGRTPQRALLLGVEPIVAAPKLQPEIPKRKRRVRRLLGRRPRRLRGGRPGGVGRRLPARLGRGGRLRGRGVDGRRGGVSAGGDGGRDGGSGGQVGGVAGGVLPALHALHGAVGIAVGAESLEVAVGGGVLVVEAAEVHVERVRGAEGRVGGFVGGGGGHAGDVAAALAGARALRDRDPLEGVVLPVRHGLLVLPLDDGVDLAALDPREAALPVGALLVRPAAAPRGAGTPALGHQRVQPAEVVGLVAVRVRQPLHGHLHLAHVRQRVGQRVGHDEVTAGHLDETRLALGTRPVGAVHALRRLVARLARRHGVLVVAAAEHLVGGVAVLRVQAQAERGDRNVGDEARVARGVGEARVARDEALVVGGAGAPLPLGARVALDVGEVAAAEEVEFQRVVGAGEGAGGEEGQGAGQGGGQGAGEGQGPRGWGGAGHSSVASYSSRHGGERGGLADDLDGSNFKIQIGSDRIDDDDVVVVFVVAVVASSGRCIHIYIYIGRSVVAVMVDQITIIMDDITLVLAKTLLAPRTWQHADETHQQNWIYRY